MRPGRKISLMFAGAMAICFLSALGRKDYVAAICCLICFLMNFHNGWYD